MRSMANQAAFLASLEHMPGAILGLSERDGRRVIALGRLTQDSGTRTIFGMVLHYSPLAEKVEPGVWLVDLEGMSAEVAEWRRVNDLPQGVDRMLGALPDAE